MEDSLQDGQVDSLAEEIAEQALEHGFPEGLTDDDDDELGPASVHRTAVYLFLFGGDAAAAAFRCAEAGQA